MHSYEESDLDLSRSLGVHALIDNMVSFISGDVGLAPAFKEPEESMSTSPQATILAMEQQQNRAEVSDDTSDTSGGGHVPVVLTVTSLLSRSCGWRRCTRS